MATVLLVVIYIAFVGLGIPDSLFGAAWPAIYPDLEISVSLGSVYSIVTSGCTVISSLASSRLVNRFGTEKVTAVSTVLTALGLLGFSLGRNIWMLCVCAIPLGLGAGAVDTVLNNYVAIHYSAKQMSFLHCAYGVGVALSPYLLSFVLAGGAGWRGGYRWMFAIQTAIALLLVLTIPLWKKVERRSAKEEPVHRKMSIREIWKIPAARSTMAVFFGSCALESMCLGWGSTWLVNCRDMDAAHAAGIITWYYVGMTLGRFLSGVVSRWLKPKQILAVGESIAAAAIALLFVPSPWTSAIALFAVGLGNGPVFPNMTYLTPIHFGEDVCQSFIGLQMAMTYGAFVITPAVFSLLARTVSVGSFPVVCLSAFALAASATILTVRRTGKDEKYD